MNEVRTSAPLAPCRPSGSLSSIAVGESEAALAPAVFPAGRCRTIFDAISARMADYAELAKLRIAVLVLVTVSVGYALGSEDRFDAVRLAHALLGITIAAAGSSTLNQWWEHRTDALMNRTRRRPIPSGRVGRSEALVFGLATALAGPLYLAVTVNPLVAGLTLLTVILYSAIYTPLKPRTALCTAIGAVPGALPPVLGWAAAQNGLTWEAFGLFAILFLWQFPHFLAIAWLYQEDYDRAGLKMVPRTTQGRSLAGLLAVGYAVALIPASLLPEHAGLAGTGYLAAALVLGLGYAFASILFYRHETAATARRLLWTSLIYLPTLLCILAWDHYRLLQ